VRWMRRNAIKDLPAGGSISEGFSYWTFCQVDSTRPHLCVAIAEGALDTLRRPTFGLGLFAPLVVLGFGLIELASIMRLNRWVGRPASSGSRLVGLVRAGC